ncbi:MAG: hypothetical protein H6863_06545 [Rhodospirillales bacterium]|nr:hypothetical protein [Rhodospirillales bacterium]
MNVSQSSSNSTSISFNPQISNILPGGSGSQDSSASTTTATTADATSANPTDNAPSSSIFDFLSGSTSSGVGGVGTTSGIPGSPSQAPSTPVLAMFGLAMGAAAFVLFSPKKKKKG